MSREIKYALAAGLLVLIGMLAGFQLKQGFSDEKVQQISNNADKFREAMWFVERNYVEPTDSKKLVDDAIKGMLEGLDPHSFYIPEDEMKAMDEQMQGSFEGIGIEFNLIEDTIYVVAPIAGGPSEQLGIRSGDRIVRIDGENVAGIGIKNSDVMAKLKGNKGSHVVVDIKRRGVKKLINFDITRDKIPLLSVDFSYMVDKNTGYMRVTRFAGTTHEEFVENLTKLKKDGMKNLILDLRDNPGGYMDKAQLMADEFLSKGKLVVYTEGRVPNSRSSYRATSEINGFEDGGLIVLMNYGSASASEIVAGAVQDWDRGIIMGVRSFGKGLVQTQKPFSDGSAIRLVISKYYTPSGRSIQKPYKMSSKEYNQEVLDRFESGEVWDMSKIDLPDSLKYETHSGRPVYGGGGILPDVFVPRDTTMDSDLLGELISNNIFREFSYEYVGDQTKLKNQYPSAKSFVDKFELTPQMVALFREFSIGKKVKYDDAQYQISKPLIDNYIKAFIGRALYNDDAFLPVLHQEDNMMKKALEMMPQAIKLEKTGKLE
ncbi:MAG: S41 family peptidase [Bacteroidia bacterium]|nr:S41 family peptidase [Bacteroidia bacterium]